MAATNSPATRSSPVTTETVQKSRVSLGFTPPASRGGGIALTNSSGQRVVGGGVSCDTRNTSLGNLDSSLNYQILKGDTTPVNLGQQWAITPSASEGNLSIPFFARYYLNGQTLSSGSANGTATFTMIYY
ncbi:fimbrial protein [Rahnella perminowiae]|uniref:fimbrial protein n=1 Tax=Rahnella perminowiae TaxID=2816244 RepID=UPI00366A42AF